MAVRRAQGAGVAQLARRIVLHESDVLRALDRLPLGRVGDVRQHIDRAIGPDLGRVDRAHLGAEGLENTGRPPSWPGPAAAGGAATSAVSVWNFRNCALVTLSVGRLALLVGIRGRPRSGRDRPRPRPCGAEKVTVSLVPALTLIAHWSGLGRPGVTVLPPTTAVFVRSLGSARVDDAGVCRPRGRQLAVDEVHHIADRARLGRPCSAQVDRRHQQSCLSA